ncbi:MAG: BlaI/MecI/CopY family transcriptional regulator [Candidatus Woesearchaeota archaeon]|nr:BlaI/MecI/CopY family transcriptional regulator [Candidatus Woesearchaeota archaeon]
MRKVDFTCKKVTLKDLVQCNYNLNESEYQIFAEIIKSKKGLSVKELVEKVQKDRTTIQKILTKLLKRELLMKRQINLDRGFMFVYFSKNKDEIVKEIEDNVKSYFEKIQESLEKWKAK